MEIISTEPLTHCFGRINIAHRITAMVGLVRQIWFIIGSNILGFLIIPCGMQEILSYRS